MVRRDTLRKMRVEAMSRSHNQIGHAPIPVKWAFGGR